MFITLTSRPIKFKGLIKNIEDIKLKKLCRLTVENVFKGCHLEQCCNSYPNGSSTLSGQHVLVTFPTSWKILIWDQMGREHNRAYHSGIKRDLDIHMYIPRRSSKTLEIVNIIKNKHSMIITFFQNFQYLLWCSKAHFISASYEIYVWVLVVFNLSRSHWMKSTHKVNNRNAQAR